MSIYEVKKYIAQVVDSLLKDKLRMRELAEVTILMTKFDKKEQDIFLRYITMIDDSWKFKFDARRKWLKGAIDEWIYSNKSGSRSEINDIIDKAFELR
jgi:hypothetical protein